MRKIVFITFLFPLYLNSSAAQWQWSIIVRNSLENAGESRAFLWIPPTCKKVKGVVVAQNNMEEIMILENPIFRRAMSDLDFAEVWCTPFFDHLFRFNQGAGDTFAGMMDDLANVSGYSELQHVPVVPMGHSAAASWPYYFAAWNPERTLAAISVSGQWPYFRSPVFAPDIWGNRTIDFVPCLETMGEYEAAATWSTEGLKERQEHPNMPLSMLACPAEGHFAASDKKIAYLALYIKKAVEYRMFHGKSHGGIVRLKPIDPTKSGWLMGKWRYNQTPTAEAAPVNVYKGNCSEAFWFFDKELVQATESYEKDYRGHKPQLVGYMQHGQLLPQHNTHLQVSPIFQPLEDGITFTLSGTFYDTVPFGSPRMEQWTGLPAGAPIGHSSGNIPVSISKICGPFQKTGQDTFVLSFDRTYDPRSNYTELVFAAAHPGDYEYKPAVQQASMIIPLKNTEGKEQHISFQEIPDQKNGTKSVILQASSDANVPVRFYILEGPAKIAGNKVEFTRIPPRSRYPIKITIVAWQYGRSKEPKLQSAQPVVRTFYILK